MTQRIFDVENEKDMADLWNILPEEVNKIKSYGIYNRYYINDIILYHINLIKINWHDKTEITRPIQEATEADIGKICKFWSGQIIYVGELRHIEATDAGKYYEMFDPIAGNLTFMHCRRLTKQEIEELC